MEQSEVRKFLLERCKDCMPYAPMILPEVIAYLECEISGDWSGWHVIDTKEQEGVKDEQQG